jgi:hypothetical protein
VAIPAMGTYPHVTVALVAEFGLARMTTAQTCTGKACIVRFPIAGYPGTDSIANTTRFPLIQQYHVILYHVIGRLYALRFIRIDFGIWYITGLTGGNNIPDRHSHQNKKDNDTCYNFTRVVHQLSSSLKGVPRISVVLSFCPFITSAFPTSS